MDFESSKTLGGVGGVLIVVGSLLILGARAGATSLGVASGAIVLVGLILVLVALSGLAGFYHEKSMFSNALYSFVAGIVGVVASAVGLLYVVFDTSTLKNLLLELYPGWNGSWSTLSSYTGTSPNTSNISSSTLLAFVGALFAVLAILWVFLIVSGFFARRSLKTLGTKSSVSLFSTAALLGIIGAFLTIVFIGFVVIWVAVLLMTIAFFQMRQQPMQVQANVAQPSPSAPTPV